MGMEIKKDIKVSFVVIALNAAEYLDSLFDCLIKQNYNHKSIEVILVDGNSKDKTKEKMISFKKKHNDFYRVIVLDNPGKTLPCGWNVALSTVSGDAILRVDAHTTFPDNFVELNVNNLMKGENICGGKVISVPAHIDNWNIFINEAENSMFGGSFAAFRRADTPRYVSTAAFAIYRKNVFDRVGKYNEELTRTEDNEMHYRMRKAGFRFYYDPKIESYRTTRSSLRGLVKQKYLNGYWIGRTLHVEPKCFSIYHFVPFIFTLSIIVTSFLAVIGTKWPKKILWAMYISVDIAMTIMSIAKCKNRNIYFILMPFVFIILHLSYGIGTCLGIVNIQNNRHNINNKEKK